MTSRVLAATFVLIAPFVLSCCGGAVPNPPGFTDDCSGPDRSDICEPGPPPDQESTCPTLEPGSRCSQGETRPCYDGKFGTGGTGSCNSGARTCNADGSAFGECMGETLARPTTCSAPTAFVCGGAAPDCGAPAAQVAANPAPETASSATAAAFDAHGNLIVAANGKGPNDETLLTVSKLDPAGNTLWSKTVASTVNGSILVNDVTATSIAVGADDHIILAGTVHLAVADFGDGLLGSSDGYTAFVTALDDSGNHLWVKDYQAMTGDTSTTLPGSVSASVAVDAAGDVYVAGSSGQGYLDSPIGFNPDSALSGDSIHGFVARLDPTGTHVWAAGLGVPAGDSAQAIGLDAAGNVYVTGFAYYTTGDAKPITNTLCGYTSVLIASFDPTGASRWSKTLGAARQQGAGTGIAVGTAGDIFVSGVLEAGLDFGPGPLPGGEQGGFLARFNSSGEHVWSRGFEHLKPVGLGLDSAGNIELCGAESRVVKLLPTNEMYLDRTALIDGTEAQDLYVGACAFGPSGNVALAGAYNGTADFGLGKLPESNRDSQFVLMLDP